MPIAIDVVTIFPEMLRGFLENSILKRATEKGAASCRLVNLRDFTSDAHRTTDERPYGGGPGMIMIPGPLFDAVESVKGLDGHVVLMSPQGQPFSQQKARELATEEHLVFVCGHYEGVDERVRESLVDEEISIGDYVLTNGVLAAAVVIDAVVRLQPGVLGCEESAANDSFENGLLEHAQYTRPADFRGMKVPEVLLSGDHGKIAEWRREQAISRTEKRRPDLLQE